MDLMRFVQENKGQDMNMCFKNYASENQIDLSIGFNNSLEPIKESDILQGISVNESFESFLKLFGASFIPNLDDLKNQCLSKDSVIKIVCQDGCFETYACLAFLNKTLDIYIDANKLKESKLTDKEIEYVWNNLTDITCDEDEDGALILGEDYFIFNKGAEREEEVWRWFDNNHSKGVGYLMNDYEEDEVSNKMKKYKFYDWVDGVEKITEHEIDANKLLDYLDKEIGSKWRFYPYDDCKYAGQICEIVDYVKFDEEDWCYLVKFEDGGTMFAYDEIQEIK